MASNNLTGVRELEAILRQVGNAPAKALTKATKKGANIMLKATKQNAPSDTGKMKRSMKLRAEKRKVGKKVYQIIYKDETLSKISRTGKRSFYPASQEHGWKLPNGRKVAPKNFQRNAMNANRSLIMETVIRELTNAIREVTS